VGHFSTLFELLRHNFKKGLFRFLHYKYNFIIVILLESAITFSEVGKKVKIFHQKCPIYIILCEYIVNKPSI